MQVFIMNTPGKLNRSYSESEINRLNLDNLCVQDSIYSNFPIVKKTVLIFEEIYSPSMLRSGRSIPSQLHNIENIHHNRSVSSHFLTDISDKIINSKLQRKTVSFNDTGDEVTPMDVDFIETNSNSAHHEGIERMDVDSDHQSYRSDRLCNLDGIKQRKFDRDYTDLHENANEFIQENKHDQIIKKREGFRCNSVFLIIILFISLIILHTWFSESLIFVNSDIQLNDIKQDLTKNVFEQKGPVTIIIRSFEHRNRWPSRMKVIGFIGPSGVGKTHVANILKKHFHKGLVHEMFGIQLNYKSQWEKIISRLKSCCLNLIIIDDINKKDITEVFALVHSLPKNYHILLISIFSIQYSDDELNYIINYNDINEIREEFDNLDLFHELAVFHQFNDQQVKDWVKKQLKVQNINYNENLLNNILCSHNASFEGFKGLYSKLLLEIGDR